MITALQLVNCLISLIPILMCVKWMNEYRGESRGTKTFNFLNLTFN